jgi:DNA-binding beta-propeller fold protein YncE
MAGGTTDNIYQYSLSTGFDITTASYDNISFSSPETSSSCVRLSPDGTKMFISGNVLDKVTQYPLSTPFDLSTAGASSGSFSILVSGQTQPVGCTFSPDGTKMFMTGYSTDDRVYQYSLSTAFDVTTASYDNVFVETGSYENGGKNTFFNPDGTQMFLGGTTGVPTDAIVLFSLSTGFDLSTASYTSRFDDAITNPNDVAFSTDGTKMFVVDITNDTIRQYSTGL